MKKSASFLIPFLFLVLLMVSCNKEGFGGFASISGIVKHHSKAIPNALVYLKFNARNAPGTSVADYDYSTVADSLGNYMIDGLKKGDYFLFGAGFDSGIGLNVEGGIPVKIATDESVVNTNIPVTEE